jgi:hypothetical protein
MILAVLLLLLLLLYLQTCSDYDATAGTCVHTVTGSVSAALPTDCRPLEKSTILAPYVLTLLS